MDQSDICSLSNSKFACVIIFSHTLERVFSASENVQHEVFSKDLLPIQKEKRFYRLWLHGTKGKGTFTGRLVIHWEAGHPVSVIVSTLKYLIP